MSDDRRIEDELAAYIEQTFLAAETSARLTDDTPLITSGVLDSVGTLTLVGFLEERFSISLQAHEADVEHLDTIAAIARLVRSKLKSGR